MTKKDKRSRKTVRAIQDTLLRLLCTKRLREIRIVDLCTEADINRTTFYLHFCGLGDVLGSLRKEIVDEIFERSEGDLISFDMPRNPLPFLTECTEVLRSYDALGNFVRLSADADAFLAKLKDEFCNRLLDSYIAAGGRQDDAAMRIIRFLTAGVLDSYTQWLKTDREEPFEEVLGTCTPLVAAGQKLLARIGGKALTTISTERE